MRITPRLTLLFIALCLAWGLLFSRCHGQSIAINGPYGDLIFITWDQLAGHTATLEYSEDMETWHPLGSYDGAPMTTECHWNCVPVWAGSYFFRTVQVPSVFAMWPADAFK